MDGGFSPEFTLLARHACQPPGAVCVETVRQLLSQGMDWEHLAALAQRHHLLPQVHAILSRGCADIVPSPVLDQVGQSCRANARRNLLMSGELVRIARAFNREGVPIAALKGPALAVEVYGGLSRRQFRDLDILVRPQDLFSAVKVLSEMGYEGEGRRLLEVSRAQRGRLVRANKHLQFFRSTGGSPLEVELHWRLGESNDVLAIPSERVWDGHAEVTLGGTKIKTIPFPEQIVFLAYHGGMHHWKRLVWLCDLSLALCHPPHLDWDALLALAARLGVERYLLAGLLVRRNLTQAHDGLPGKIERLLRRRQRDWRGAVDSVYHAMLAGEMYYESRPLGNMAWRFCMSSGVTAKLRSLRATLTPRSGDLLQRGYWRSSMQRSWQLATRCFGLFFRPRSAQTTDP